MGLILTVWLESIKNVKIPPPVKISRYTVFVIQHLVSPQNKL